VKSQIVTINGARVDIADAFVIRDEVDARANP
jgi:hypothetical protein